MGIYSDAVESLSRKYIKKSDKVFDCGCGNGFHTFLMQKYAQESVGGDLENRTWERFNVNFRKIKPNEYGQENEFDVVCSFDVIEHVEDDLEFLKQLIEIAKPGGRIIIGTPNENRLSCLIKSVIGTSVKYPCKIGYHYSSGGDIIHLRGYQMEDLEKLAAKTGQVKVIERRTVFFGLYFTFGPIGIRRIPKPLKKFGNHLFIVLEKNNV